MGGRKMLSWQGLGPRIKNLPWLQCLVHNRDNAGVSRPLAFHSGFLSDMGTIQPAPHFRSSTSQLTNISQCFTRCPYTHSTFSLFKITRLGKTSRKLPYKYSHTFEQKTQKYGPTGLAHWLSVHP